MLGDEELYVCRTKETPTLFWGEFFYLIEVDATDKQGEYSPF